MKPIIALVLLTCFLTACGVKIQGIEIDRLASALSDASNLGTKSEEAEIQLGHDTSTSLLKLSSPANDDVIQRYVNNVGYWLVQHTSRPDLPWRFIVLDDTAINAFAAPGGYIFITTGMIASLSNEAELAGVLAHEIAHVLQRHHLDALQTKAQRGLISNLAVLGVQTSQVKDYRDGKDSTESDTSSLFERNVKQLYNKGLDRADELEADRIGIQLAAKAGYDPYAFVGVLQAIQSRESKSHEALTKFIATHPSADQRLSQLEPTLMKLEQYELEMKVLRGRFVARTRY